ncbi:MAG TPA: hypothetical protein VF824_14545 [Thermoanaerobaculia bacterium]|jgi:hypothetical protein
MRRVLPLVLIAAAACSTAPQRRSAREFTIAIVEAPSPLVQVRSRTEPSVARFRLLLSNVSDVAYTIDQVIIESVEGSTYAVPDTTRVFDQLLPAGEQAELVFDTSITLAAWRSTSTTLRATIEAHTADGRKHVEVLTARLPQSLQQHAWSSGHAFRWRANLDPQNVPDDVYRPGSMSLGGAQ